MPGVDVAVEEAEGLSGGEGNEVPSVSVLHEGRRGICPWRGETLSTGVRSPFLWGRPARSRWRGAGVGGAGGGGEEGEGENGQGGVQEEGPVHGELGVVQPGH